MISVLAICVLLFSAEAFADENKSEDDRKSTTLTMRYDDALDISGKTVKIIDRGKPSSFRVGYDVEEKIPDKAVIRKEGNKLIAAGVGTAKIDMDGDLYEVTVTAAPISLLLLSGQSNMQGVNGNPGQSIVCPDGQVYASFADGRLLNQYTAEYLAPSSLTGDGAAVNTIGTTEFLCDYPVDALTGKGNGKGGPDSGLAYEWVKDTGEKVWVVNTAQSGASINLFQKYCADYIAVVKLFSACQRTLKKEIAAGHYTLSHMGMFWCQGCADANQSANWYAARFQTMYNNLKKDLSIDMDSDPATPEDTLEFANIIMVLGGGEKKLGYRAGTNRPKTNGYYGTFKELEMTGPRVAQYWLGANPEFPEINVVCNIGDIWMTRPDGNDGVEQYFSSHYDDGHIDYPTREVQSEDWYRPTKPGELKSSIHYNQVGYNEIGIEAARNTCILLGYVNDTDEETAVQFVDWRGYETVTSVEPSAWGKSETLVVPLVTPVYRAKTVNYELSDGLQYVYYDLLTDKKTNMGKLAVTGKPEVMVNIG